MLSCYLSSTCLSQPARDDRVVTQRNQRQPRNLVAKHPAIDQLSSHHLTGLEGDVNLITSGKYILNSQIAVIN